MGSNLMRRTLSQQFAVGAFNVDNLEIFKAIVLAAKAKHSPVLVEVSQTEVDFIGHQNIVDMVKNTRQEGVEIYLNLDHAPSLEAAKKGIDQKFDFVHIDVSNSTTLEENIKITRQVVELAHPRNILVESEMEYFSGSSNVHKEDISLEEVKSHYTDPNAAKKFVQKTGIDIFAASIGNLHGLYPTPKVLDIDLLKKIRKKIDCYISLHGGSGTPPHFFKEAIAAGVSKININSEIRQAFRANLEKVIRENPDEYAMPKIEEPVIKAVQKVVEEHMDIFGSTGKAVT